jgi:N-methylhydantoinase A
MNGTGHPIRVPVVDLAEVSSGGGSIAWLDEGGALKVGPRSAGSEPGPACYGKGGTLATVTDANVVLGYLNPRSLLDGDLKMDFKAASEAIRVHLADPMGISVLSAAARVNEVVNSSMVNALRMVTVERGNDPQEFALMAFGGAGPIHAVALAEELKLPEVIIPPVPGAFSALGLVATDLRRDYSRTLYSDLKSVDPAEVEGAFAEMEERAAVMLDTAQVAALQREFVRSADVRYRRQAYELTVPFDGDGPVSGAMLERLAQKFHSQHEKTYGHSNEDEPVQLVNLRLKALGKLPALRLKQNTGGGKAKGATRKTWFPRTGEIASTVLWRDALTIGEVIEGPAIVESLDSTIVIPPTWAGEVEPNGYIRIRRV